MPRIHPIIHFNGLSKILPMKKKTQLLHSSLLRRQLVGHMRAMRRPQQPRLGLFGGAHGGGDVGLQAVEAGQGHGARRHGTSSLGTLGWLGRKTHLAEFHGLFFWGVGGFFLGCMVVT